MKKSVSIKAEPVAGGEKGVPKNYSVANLFTVTPVVTILGINIPTGRSSKIILPCSVKEAVEKVAAIKENFAEKKNFNDALPGMVEVQLINQGFSFYTDVQKGAASVMDSFGKNFGYMSAVDVIRTTGETYDRYMKDKNIQKKVAQIHMAGLNRQPNTP